MQIIVKSSFHAEYPLNVEPSDTIEILVEKINEKERLPAGVRIIFGGKFIYMAGSELPDVHKTLADYNIQNGSTIITTLNLRGD